MEYLPSITNDLTKSQIKIIAESYIEQITEKGKILDLADLIAKMEILLKEIRSNPDYMEEVRGILAQYGGSFTTHGTKLELAETGVKYDYTHCGCSELTELYQTKETISEKIKSLESFLKALDDGGVTIVKESTGEIEKWFPPAKTSLSSYKATICK